MESWDLLSTSAPEGTRDPVVLYSNHSGRAVLVVLKPGQSLGEHQVKEHAWLTVVEGSVQVTAGGSDHDLAVGCLAHFEPDERHAVHSADGARVLLLLAPWPGEGHYRGDAA